MNESEIAQHVRRRGWLSHWDRHPGVRTGDELTVGERAADAMRRGMGSWPFVFVVLALLTIWMGYNKGDGFDPYPFILLNLMLSCVAAMQGAIILIAAKRSDQVSSETAMHDYETDKKAAQRIEEMHVKLENLAAHNALLLDRIAAALEIKE